MQIKNREQWMLVVAIGLVTLFMADRILLGPMVKQWQARSKRIAELRKDVTDGKRLLEREENIRTRWQVMNTNTLPVNNSLAEQQVLKAFDAWSQDSRISVMAITPQWKRDNDDFRTLSCRVEASGNLSTVTRFLYEIERDPMGLRIESMELSARDAQGQSFALGLQVSGLVLTLQENKR